MLVEPPVTGVGVAAVSLVRDFVESCIGAFPSDTNHLAGPHTGLSEEWLFAWHCVDQLENCHPMSEILNGTRRGAREAG